MCKDTVGTNSLSKICKSCGSEFVPFSIEQRSCQNCLDKFVQVERELQTKFPNRKISYCSVCGRPFIKRGTQSICSEAHFVECCICGKSYEVKQFDKYGNPSPKTCSTVCSTELRKQTNLERFGVDNPSKAKEIQDKKEQTTLKHFGVMYPAQSKKVQQKMQNTMVERYGVEHPYQCDGDAECTEFEDSSFDAVVLRDVLWNSFSPEKILIEAKRLLKDGGSLIITDGNWRRNIRNWTASNPDSNLFPNYRKRDLGYGAYDIIDKYYDKLPLSDEVRPDWDRDVLSEMGMTVSRCFEYLDPMIADDLRPVLGNGFTIIAKK